MKLRFITTFVGGMLGAMLTANNASAKPDEIVIVAKAAFKDEGRPEVNRDVQDFVRSLGVELGGPEPAETPEVAAAIDEIIVTAASTPRIRTAMQIAALIIRSNINLYGNEENFEQHATLEEIQTVGMAIEEVGRLILEANPAEAQTVLEFYRPNSASTHYPRDATRRQLE
jgi:hypothetical protein